MSKATINALITKVEKERSKEKEELDELLKLKRFSNNLFIQV
jgi:hypothetical protein